MTSKFSMEKEYIGGVWAEQQCLNSQLRTEPLKGKKMGHRMYAGDLRLGDKGVRSKAILLLVLSGWFLGCSLFSSAITYYDPTTYKNLTDLKPEVVLLYESFVEASIDSLWIRSIRLKLAQMYEYEKGKGEKNEPTYRQIRILKEMFERHVKERINRGPWSAVNAENTIENISEAFDIAISTERLKNKNEEEY